MSKKVYSPKLQNISTEPFDPFKRTGLEIKEGLYDRRMRAKLERNRQHPQQRRQRHSQSSSEKRKRRNATQKFGFSVQDVEQMKAKTIEFADNAKSFIDSIDSIPTTVIMIAADLKKFEEGKDIDFPLMKQRQKDIRDALNEWHSFQATFGTEVRKIEQELKRKRIL